MGRPAADSRPVAVLLTALVAFGPISTDLYLASLPDMARSFGTDVPMVQLTLSVFLAGFALSMPVYGPLSDRFGRRPVILGGVVIYLAASLFCIFAPTIEALILGRFLQALGACCGPVVGRAVVRDVYPREQAAKVLSYMASAMALAPFAAPMAGGWFHAMFGWRSNFVLLTLFGVGLLAATWRLLGETNSQPDAQALSPARMAGNYRTLLSDRRVLGYMLTVAAAFGGMFTFISGSSFVLIDVLGLKPEQFGFGFATVIGGYVVGGYLAGRFTGRLGLDRVVTAGVAGCALSGLAGAGLAWAGFASLGSVLAPMAAFFFSSAFVLPNCTAGAIAPHPRMAGAASALVGFIQMAGGAVAGLLVAGLFDGTPLAMMGANGALGVAALAAFLLLVRRG